MKMRNFKAPKMLKSLDFIMVEGLKLATDRRTFLHFEGFFGYSTVHVSPDARDFFTSIILIIHQFHNTFVLLSCILRLTTLKIARSGWQDVTSTRHVMHVHFRGVSNRAEFVTKSFSSHRSVGKRFLQVCAILNIPLIRVQQQPR